MLADGVYLDLPEEVYHADQALGSTDLKRLLAQPAQWHWKNRNPVARELAGEAPEASAGMRFGSAFHKMVLEGPEAFEAAYALEPERPDGLLKSIAEIQGWLIDGGLYANAPKKSAPRAEWLAYARECGCTLLLDDWTAATEAELAGREAISRQWHAAIAMAQAVMLRHSAASRVLRGGLAEVSVFWTDERGIRLKCRFDYLRIKTTVDVKTFALRDDDEPIDGFCRQVASYAYDLQAAHYHDLRTRALPALIDAGHVYRWVREAGEGLAWIGWEPAHGSDRELICKIAEASREGVAEPPSWTWLAFQTLGAPAVDVIEFPLGGVVHGAALSQLQTAKDNYARYREAFGDDDAAMWIEDRGRVLLSDMSLPSWITSRGVPKWETP